MASDQKTIRMAVGWNKYEDITLAQLNEELEEIRKTPKKVDLSPAKDVVEYKWVEEVSTAANDEYHKWCLKGTDWSIYKHSSWSKHPFYVYIRGMDPNGKEEAFPTLEQAKKRVIELMTKAQLVEKAIVESRRDAINPPPPPKSWSVVLQQGLTITSQYNGLGDITGYILFNSDGAVVKVYPTLEGAKKGAERIQKRLDKQADIEASKRGEADLGLYRAIGLVEDRIKKTKHKFESIYVGPGVTEEYDMKRGELNALEALSKSLKKMLSTHGKPAAK